MANDIKMVYSAVTREAVFTFVNGERLSVGNLTPEQAVRFHERHAPEFGRRGCRFHSGETETRAIYE
jgi:hypothetical protein